MNARPWPNCLLGACLQGQVARQVRWKALTGTGMDLSAPTQRGLMASTVAKQKAAQHVRGRAGAAASELERQLLEVVACMLEPDPDARPRAKEVPAMLAMRRAAKLEMKYRLQAR
jgi:hypothetical protein